MRKIYKSTIGIAAAALLAGSLAACSTPAADTETRESADTSSEAAADPEPIAEIADLSNGVDTQVTVDAGFVEALTSLGLTPAPVGSATFDASTGVFSFPITGGNVDYYDPEEDYRPYVQGEVLHDGSGISLTNGETTVELTDFRIDPGSNSTLFGTVTANGEQVGTDIPLFRLDGTTLNPLDTETEPGNAILEGTTVYVSEDAAALLNETYGTTAVTGDLEVGIAKITASLG